VAFPGTYAQVHYNEAGEPTGWDNAGSFEPPEPDPGDFDPACFDPGEPDVDEEDVE
jgi:hypothetical protein